MEEAFKELEEMRRGMEMLKAERKADYHHSESLKRAFEEQQAKLQNARVEIEQQAKVIDVKSEEISMVKQKYEDLQSIFQEKESALKQLSLANESMRTGFKEKIKELEQVNKELVFALDETNVKAEEQENMVCGYKNEIVVLKALLSESQKKLCAAELRAQEPKELRRRDEMLDELVSEKVEIEDRLKWKTEQFWHLEEALNKIQLEFRASKKEWESEKSNLLNNISSLQSSLDFEIQTSNDLGSQLQMCNLALAHEESQRRLLEIQMHESKERYDNIVLEYEEVKSNIETLTARRDEEIASVRNSLSAKNILLKELEFKNTFFEQENEKLLESLKEAQEAQINGVEALASLKSLRQKFRALVLVHKECSDKLKSREAHWSQQNARITGELHECLLKLKSNDHENSNLKEELENSQCLAMQATMEKEESFTINIILKSKFMELCCDLMGLDLIVERANERAEERVAFLTEQLENMNISLTKAMAEVSEERMKVYFLQSKVEQLKSVHGEFLSVQKELSSSKGMVAELSRTIDRVKEQAAQKELDLQDNLRRTSYDLEKANSSFSEKVVALDVVEFELQQQRNVVKELKKAKCNLEIELQRNHNENQESKRCMENAILEKMEMEKSLKEAEENFLLTLEGKERKVVELEIIKVILEERLPMINLHISAVPKMLLPQSMKKKLYKFQVLLESLEVRLNFFQDIIDLLEQNHGASIDNIWMSLEKLRAAFIDFMEGKINVISNIHRRILTYDEIYFSLVEAAANSMFLEQREELIDQIMGLGDLIGKISGKGEEVRKNWDKILQTNDGVDTVTDMEREDLISCKMTHGRKYSPPLLDKGDEIFDRRLPLKEHNFNF